MGDTMPRPWAIYRGEILSITAGNQFVADVWGRDEANAALIVAAVNSFAAHRALVEAAKHIQEAWNTGVDAQPRYARELRAALAAVEEASRRRGGQPMNSYKFREFEIRPDMVKAIRLYVDKGFEPGDFLTAVICNNLSEAIGRADSDNMRNLPAFVAYFYNECPAPCWGSRAKMDAWIALDRENVRG